MLCVGEGRHHVLQQGQFCFIWAPNRQASEGNIRVWRSNARNLAEYGYKPSKLTFCRFKLHVGQSQRISGWEPLFRPGKIQNQHRLFFRRNVAPQYSTLNYWCIKFTNYANDTEFTWHYACGRTQRENTATKAPTQGVVWRKWPSHHCCSHSVSSLTYYVSYSSCWWIHSSRCIRLVGPVCHAAQFIGHVCEWIRYMIIFLQQ